MTTTSYPAQGDDGLTTAQWANMYSSQDGILDDYMTGGVLSCSITRNNSTDICTISPGLVRVNGYVLEVLAAHDLSTPAVTSTTTYRIAVMYDPALNVADGDGTRSDLGPCRLIVTPSALDTSGGKQYTLLYEITRSASQVLSAAPMADRRRWVAQIVELPDYIDLPPGFGPFPRGTLIMQTQPVTGATSYPGSFNLLVRTVNDTGTALVWKSLTGEADIAFPSSGTLAANVNDVPASMCKEFTRVYLAGTLRRTSGANLNTGSAVVLGRLPVGWRPFENQRFLVLGSGPTPVGVIVQSDGFVQMYDPPGAVNVAYIQLNGISFRAER